MRHGLQKRLFRISAAAAVSVTGLAQVSRAGSTIPYSGGTYTQNFNALPSPGATSVNTANPVTINGTSYSLQNPIFDFANPVDTTGAGSSSASGGLGLSSTMPGWYGGDPSGGTTKTQFGATNGDQTTGGILDFGPNSGGTGNTNDRALGLIATGTSGVTTFGAAIVNGTGQPINAMNLAFTWEFWKQGGTAKTVTAGYTVDNPGALTLLTAASSSTPLSTSPTEATGAVGAVDGTLPANQSAVNLQNQPLSTTLAPNGVLWLTWQINSSASGGQGFGIDNLTFSSSASPEPASAALVVGAALLLSARRRKRA